MALARFRNTETDEIVELNADWLERWPDDPYELVTDAAAPATEPPAAPAKTSGGTPAGDDPARGRF